MPNIPRVDLRTGQVPTEADWESFWNQIIDYLNAGIPPEDLQKNAQNRVAIDIAGDAMTLNGLTAVEIQGGQQPGVAKTLIDLLVGTAGGIVLSGGVATRNSTTLNQLDITACTVVQRHDTLYLARADLPAASKTTTLANATYYLDVIPGAVDYYWDVTHPPGSYVPLATVTTDANANIATVLDTRPLAAKLLGGFNAKVNAEDFLVGVLDQALVPTGNTTATTSLRTALSWIANRLKTGFGTANWWETPSKTLPQVDQDSSCLIWMGMV